MGLAAVFIAGTAMQAIGQYNQGRALKDQAEAEQDILNFNADIKDREAKAQLERSRAEALRFEREGEQLQGRQQVALAKGGVLSSTGTPALLMETTADTLDQDRMSILREGFLAQATKEQEAEGLRFQGRAARSRGRNMKTASDLSIGTSLLTSGASFMKGGSFA